MTTATRQVIAARSPQFGAAAAERFAAGSLRRNFTWTLAANVVYAACQWGLLISIARLTTPEQTGDFIFGLSVTAPVMLLAGLQLRLAHAADAGRVNSARHYLTVRLRATLVALLVIGAIALFLRHSAGQTAILLFVAGNKSIEAMIDQCYGAFQQQQRMDLVARSMIGRGVASLLLATAVLFATRSVWASVFCMMLVSGVFLVARDLRLCRVLDGLHRVAGERRSGHSQGALVRQTLPLGAVSMLYSVNTNAPRILVQNALGSSALGIYGSINYLHTLGQTFAGALVDSSLPKMARALQERDLSGFWRMYRQITAVIFLVCAAGIVLAFGLGSELLSAFFGPAYSRYFVLLRWQSVTSSLLLLALPMSYGMIAARAYRAQLWIVVITVAVTVGISQALVGRNGIVGVALASFWASLAHLVLFAAALIHSIRRCCPDRSAGAR